MKKKTKILIITGACILILGGGTGITIHAVKKSANATVTNSGISNFEEISDSSEADMKNGVLTTISDDKNTSDTSANDNLEDTTEKANVSTNQVASDSKENTATNSTTGKSTGSSVTQTTSTSGNSFSRTTESNNTNTTEDKKNTADNTTESTEHVHNWEAVYKTVHHETTYKEEQYVISEGWIEYVWLPEILVCNRCGATFDAEMAEDPSNPLFEEFNIHVCTCGADPNIPGSGGSSYHLEWPYEEVIHPTEYGTRQVVDEPAWDEQVVDYYKCTCGATTRTK